MRPSPGSLLRLTLGSSIAVSTALCIPDAFAILPSCPDALSWVLRTTGLWTSAYIQWSASFLAILHLTRIVSGGIQLDQTGIKLWRFGRVIPWENVLAATITDRKSFSRLLFISPVALELTLHVQKPAPKKGREAKKIPSFQYDPQDFASLVYYVGKFAFNVKPASVGAVMFKPAEAEDLRKMSQEGRLKHMMLTTFIAFSLVLLLARNAATNYTFNMGNVYTRKGEYKKAIEYYSMSTAINPWFPPAWDRLARSELRAGDPESAMEHWKKALQVKPDFVESKLGLSVLYMRSWELDKALELILTCNRLAPKDEAGFINLAQVRSMMGNHREAIRILNEVIQQNRGRDLARCLLALCYLRVGEIERARDTLPKTSTPGDAQANAFRILVEGKLAAATGDDATAEKLYSQLYRGDKHVDLLLAYAELKIDKGQLAAAEKMLLELQHKQLAQGSSRDQGVLPPTGLPGIRSSEQEGHGSSSTTGVLPPTGVSGIPTSEQEGQGTTSSPGAGNPWMKFARARIAFAKGDKMDGQWQIEEALKTPYKDPALLAACATALLDAGARERALQLIEQATKIDPESKLVIGARAKADKK